MLKNFFKKKKSVNSDNKNILIASLLIHAAKIDENYTDLEKKLIREAMLNLNKLSEEKTDELMKIAEKKEMESSQIIEFTKEVKKYPMEFRLKIIEIIWKIVYSDNTQDVYESNLIRRICGLLYVSDRDSGIIKMKVQKLSGS